MRKLGKKVTEVKETVEAYACSCYCSCSCTSGSASYYQTQRKLNIQAGRHFLRASN